MKSESRECEQIKRKRKEIKKKMNAHMKCAKPVYVMPASDPFCFIPLLCEFLCVTINRNYNKIQTAISLNFLGS